MPVFETLITYVNVRTDSAVVRELYVSYTDSAAVRELYGQCCIA